MQYMNIMQFKGQFHQLFGAKAAYQFHPIELYHSIQSVHITNSYTQLLHSTIYVPPCKVRKYDSA
jgi:hypothetical protein